MIIGSAPNPLFATVWLVLERFFCVIKAVDIYDNLLMFMDARLNVKATHTLENIEPTPTFETSFACDRSAHLRATFVPNKSWLLCVACDHDYVVLFMYGVFLMRSSLLTFYFVDCTRLRCCMP